MTMRALLLPLFLGLAAGSARAGDAYEEGLRAYQKDVKDNALVRRTQARARLAMTRDVRAMRVLAKDYAKPEAPEAQVRYLIAHIASRYFEDRSWVEPFQEWLDASTKPRDAWLWFLGRSVHARHADEDALVAPLDPKLSCFLRAAAIEGVASTGRVEAAALVGSELDALGTAKGVERGVILGSLAAVARSLKAHLGHESVVPVLARLIDQIDDERTPGWAALTIARQLAALLEMDVTLQTAYLHSVLEGRTGPRSGDDDRYARPTFMGVKASGQRIGYVIDCSDSMLTPLTGKEKKSLREPAITGDHSSGPKKKPSLEDELDWDGIQTRFDLAREYLKLSLLGLTKDQSFVVVCFGTEAQLLDGTKGMAKATKSAVKKAIRSLDAMKAGPATETRVHGTLMGDTNYHAAFMTAFGVAGKGTVKGPAYVGANGFATGCDTIFFLSDGRPTADNWPGTGPMSGPGGYRDRETGKRVAPAAGGGGTGNVIHVGPYADGGFYLDGEIQRMNLLRKAEIHCLGIGEARQSQLQSIAKVGLGKVRMIGREDED